MGQLILPSGGTMSLDDIHGTTELSSLVRELKITELTDQYRVAVIGCLGRIGRSATIAVVDLKKIKESNNRILREAATQAIEKIESDTSFPVVSPSVTVVPPPVTPSPNQVIPSVSTPAVGTHRSGRYHGPVAKEKTRVELIPVKKTEKLFDDCPTINECMFCSKLFETSRSMTAINNALTGKERYCRFCMRNRYYKPEISKNVIILTYRALIGYAYYSFIPNKTQIYVHDMREMIQDHVNATFSNPLFNYDPDTYNWFIDMNPVIEGKIDVKSIGPTIACQLSALGMGEIFYRGTPHLIYRKIMDRLAAGDKFIMPMPSDGGSPKDEKGIPKEYLKEFISSHLADGTTTNKRKWESKKGNYDGYCC